MVENTILLEEKIVNTISMLKDINLELAKGTVNKKIIDQLGSACTEIMNIQHTLHEDM